MVERTDRQQIIEDLKMYFLKNLCEAAQNGTIFDSDVLDTLEELQEKYGRECHGN